VNPFRLEGQKTIMFRVLEALRWEVPDWIVVPGGNLGNSSAFGKAFIELKALGLIDRLLPGARVIHCRRDPMDTCLSCFTHNLAGIHAYSNDLATLGAYYRAYRALMQHWQQVLHIPLLDVDYEALVNDQEAVTRRLLAFCGLEWDARCLRFHESARVAATASHNQVRQPLYRGAIGKWQRYAHQLQPLVDALADAGEQRRTR